MRLAPIACALLIVLAGCGGVMDATTPAATESDEPSTPSTSVTVLGDLPFDATTVFERVTTLTGERVDGPVVYVEPPSEMSTSVLDARRSSFRAALGIDPPARNDSERLTLAAYAASDGNSVHVNEETLSDPVAAEVTVAHEFVHVVQFRRGWADSVWFVDPAVRGGMNYDGRLTYYLVIEGAAEYVEDDYVEQFLPERAGEDSLRAAYRNGSAYQRLNLARYVLGAEYVADRVDSPGELASVHRSPPRSSEQVLHNSTDPVESLTVTTGDTGNWSERHRDRQGELFLRIALRTELNRSAAVDAAAGWGEDRRITFERGNRTATAWTLHWDDAANATEFERSFRRYLDAKATREGGVWSGNENGSGNATAYRVVEPNEETTVVLLGDESFVRRATVNATLGDVVKVGVSRSDRAAP
ncbi:hypothetical protein JCM30237_06820 [Halolamina litorea]|uniref:DUF4157 domain-containing protein n=1 Tax=Halolamina litorea TaxID=1515593 RepID=A0ABD6BSE0_9EURY|nr:hypothetical protein [Halolamina litorea]